MKKFLITFFFALLMLTATTITASAETVMVEAEDFEIHSSFELASRDDASGGKYITSLTNHVLTDPTMAKLGEVNAETTINIPKTGTYTIYLRVTCPTYGIGDSVYFSCDTMLYYCGISAYNNEFVWSKVTVYKFTEGEHTIRLYSRESGGSVDKIVITSDPFFVPEGFGEAPENETVLYENGQGDIRAPLPAVVPPANEHPRLLVRSSDLPRIRENLNHPQNKAAYERVLEKAQSKSTGDQRSYSADLLEIMQSKAFLYIVNGDEEKGKEAVDMVMNHIRKATVTTSAADSSTMRFAGHIVFATSCVYDWCYDLFTPEQRQEYIEKAEDLITINFEGGYPHVETKDQFTGGHNVENPWYKDVLAFGVAVYDEKPFVYNNVAGTLNMNYIPFLNWYYPTHWMPQGVSTYGDFRYSFEIFCAYIFDALGQKPFVGEGAHYSAYKSIYWRRPDGAYIPDADCAKVYNNVYTKNANGNYFLLGNMFKDPIMKWQYYKNKGSDDYFNQSYTGVNAPEYLIMNDTTVELDNTKSLPLTKYYPSPVGNMIARTSWEEGADSPAVICAMKPMGTHFSQHQHMEVGNFVLYYKGMLALDSGTYESPAYVKADGTSVSGSYWGSSHYVHYMSRPIAHNILEVYDANNPSEIAGGGQRIGDYDTGSFKTISKVMNGENKVAENIGYDYGPDKNEPEYSYLEADLTCGYRSDRVKDYTRSYMFLNLFDDEIPAALIVYDRMEATEASLQKSWLLHSQEEPKIEGNKITIDRTEIHNNGRLTDTVLMPEKTVIDKVGGEGMEYWNGVANYEIYRQPEGDESGTWRIEIKPAEKRTKDYFLNVIQVSDPDDSIEHHEVTSNEQSDFIGIFIADRAVFMKKDKGSVYMDFTVTAEENGNEEISYIITDLAEGKWIVTDLDGKEIYSEAISGEHGVLRFRTAPGTYNVHWEFAEGIEPKNFDIIGDAVDLGYTPVDIFVNNKNYNGRGRIEDGTIFVSIDDFTELTNRASFTVDGDRFFAKGGYGEIEGKIGSTTVKVNGEEQTLSAAPFEYEGKIYLPLDECLHQVYEFVSEYDDLTYILYFRGGYYMVPGADVEIVNSEERNRADIITATCSGIDAVGNEPYASIDNNMNTYWCSGGYDEWIIYELADEYEITGVGTAWLNGTKRQEHYALFVSEDGEKWTEMWRGDASGNSSEIEDVMFNKPAKARYLKIECYGNTAGQMNSLLETHIYCTEKIPYYEK